MQMGGGVGGIVWPQQMVQLPAAPNPASSTTAATTTATSPSPVVDQVEQQQQQQQDQNLPADPQQQQQQPQIRMNAQGIFLSMLLFRNMWLFINQISTFQLKKVCRFKMT